MREYFSIMIKENDTSTLKLLTEKLNEGFVYDNQYTVGRSTVITLQKYTQTRENLIARNQQEYSQDYGALPVATSIPTLRG
jgi:hypothetical protein